MSGIKTIGQNVRFLSNLCWIWCPSLPPPKNIVVTDNCDDDAFVEEGSVDWGGGAYLKQRLAQELQNRNNMTTAQCINGDTGLVHPYLDAATMLVEEEKEYDDGVANFNTSRGGNDCSSTVHDDDYHLHHVLPSFASTFSLTKLFLELKYEIHHRYEVGKQSKTRLTSSINLLQNEKFNLETMALTHLRTLKRKCSPSYERHKDELLRKKSNDHGGGSLGDWKRREEGVLLSYRSSSPEK